MIGQFSSLATSYNTFDCISQFVCALWLGSLVGNISLFAPVNSKVCLNWNLLPLFDPRGVTSLYCKLQSVVFFHSDLWAWRLGHESKHEKTWSVTYNMDLELGWKEVWKHMYLTWNFFFSALVIIGVRPVPCSRTFSDTTGVPPGLRQIFTLRRFLFMTTISSGVLCQKWAIISNQDWKTL